MNLSNTTLPPHISQQPLLATRNDLIRIKTYSTNPTLSNRSTNINSKPSYAYALNPVIILNPNADLRPQKSFVDVVTGGTTLSILVKLIQLHKDEPAVHFSAAEI